MQLEVGGAVSSFGDLLGNVLILVCCKDGFIRQLNPLEVLGVCFEVLSVFAVCEGEPFIFVFNK
jgi:hypothetical protein